MAIHRNRLRIGGLGLSALLLVGGVGQTQLFADDPPPPAPAPPPPPPGGGMFRGGEFRFNGPPELQRYIDLLQQAQQAPGADLGKYWIGAECREAPPELTAQLGLKEDEGVVVVHLIDEGPAAKAGLKQHDIILSAGDTKLHHPPELVKAINASDGKEVSLKIMRAGKEQTITVQPAERPQNNLQVFARPGPGMMFGGAGGPPKIPDNMTISIVRQGGKPAKITVTRGDDKWDVTEGELDKLPEDVRPIVQGALGGGPMTIRLPGGMNVLGMQGDGRGQPDLNRQLMQMFGQRRNDSGPNPPPPQGDGERRDGERRDGERRGPPDGGAGPGPGPDLMHRLDEIDRHLQRLEDELHGMRGGPNNTRDGGPPDGRPRMRADGRPPMGEDGAQGPPPDGDRRGPPDGQRRGPPPDGGRRGPPPDGERGGPPPVE